MAFALIRSDLLTALSRHAGTKTQKILQEKIREFLSAEPGAWLPEQFFSAFELVDRSIRNTSPEGRQNLFAAIEVIVDSLQNELLKGSLSKEEARQLLGIMSLSKRHKEIINDPILHRVVCFAMTDPNSFWAKVTPAVDIVGPNLSDREEFVDSVFAAIPKRQQKKLRLETLKAG